MAFLRVASLQFGRASRAEQETDAIDSQGMRLLSYILLPLSIGGAVYSLYYQPHKRLVLYNCVGFAQRILMLVLEMKHVKLS